MGMRFRSIDSSVSMDAVLGEAEMETLGGDGGGGARFPKMRATTAGIIDHGLAECSSPGMSLSLPYSAECNNQHNTRKWIKVYSN